MTFLFTVHNRFTFLQQFWTERKRRRLTRDTQKTRENVKQKNDLRQHTKTPATKHRMQEAINSKTKANSGLPYHTVGLHHTPPLGDWLECNQPSCRNRIRVVFDYSREEEPAYDRVIVAKLKAKILDIIF